ncbi:MAG TPA: hypothetical protein VMT19_00665 [Thermoanaerobaculaceae bacterium]|nr:hypothetical protein [Thermoanaerobaculaceae bacterium]
MVRKLLVAAAVLAVASPTLAREMTSAYVVTAVANKAGLAGTDWHSDVTLYNPQSRPITVKMFFLPSGLDNSQGAPEAPLITLDPWQTLNLWDILGSSGFNARGWTGALLVYADTAASGCPGTSGDTSCDFAVFGRNYTLDVHSADGEFGQDFPGFPASLGVDSSVIAYMPQISDDEVFRTNVGVASWTSDWVTVRVDLQDEAGNIVARHDHLVPPYGHVQWRLEDGISGGTLAAYIVGGPSDAMVYPYATVVNWATGDATTVEAQISPVGFTTQSMSVRRAALRAVPRGLPVPGFSLEGLKARVR